MTAGRTEDIYNVQNRWVDESNHEKFFIEALIQSAEKVMASIIRDLLSEFDMIYGPDDRHRHIEQVITNIRGGVRFDQSMTRRKIHYYTSSK